MSPSALRLCRLRKKMACLQQEQDLLPLSARPLPLEAKRVAQSDPESPSLEEALAARRFIATA